MSELIFLKVSDEVRKLTKNVSSQWSDFVTKLILGRLYLMKITFTQKVQSKMYTNTHTHIQMKLKSGIMGISFDVFSR